MPEQIERSTPEGTPELIISIANPEMGLTTEVAQGREPSPLHNFLVSHRLSLTSLRAPGEQRVGIAGPAPSLAPDDPAGLSLACYFQVNAPVERQPALALALQELPGVAAAYIKPPAIPAIGPRQLAAPAVGTVSGTVTSFTQAYLESGPVGVGARDAWSEPGGRGELVQIVDMEGGWRVSHETLQHLNHQLPIWGVPKPQWRDHGTAVLATLGGAGGIFGLRGIAPNSTLRHISIFQTLPATTPSTSRAIEEASNGIHFQLAKGDILLIELHRAGPMYDFRETPDQSGYLPIEWWPDDFLAIRDAVRKGIIVVAVAGNGAVDLDDPLYDIRPTKGERKFPDTWVNPLKRLAGRDSGAILVGAGAPPVDRMRFGPDRSRLAFSNFGACVDAQAWGAAVATAGYGDLQAGANEDKWYTGYFCGTSNAAPMVAGILACLQGALKARNLPLLTPDRARRLVTQTGHPQEDAPGRPKTQHIGNRPDFRQMLAAAMDPNF
jgi:hypothetical protein